jgi:putative FmdB family regulatory protein
MPIYAYRCAACGHAKDVLQKISDAPLTVCPSCGQARFEKQVTAAGFQLKGSGWYVTDFREGAKKPAKPGDGATDKPEAKPNGGSGPTQSADAKPAPANEAPSSAPAATAPAAAPPPAASS